VKLMQMEDEQSIVGSNLRSLLQSANVVCQIAKAFSRRNVRTIESGITSDPASTPVGVGCINECSSLIFRSLGLGSYDNPIIGFTARSEMSGGKAGAAQQASKTQE
jgi:hypothetical protein